MSRSRPGVTTATQNTIRWPVADVWAELARFGAIVEWAPRVDHSCILRGGPEAGGVGTERRIQTGRLTVVERIVTWEPESCLAYDIDGLPPVIRSVRNTWTLTPARDHADVTLTTTVDAGPRPPQKLVARIVARRLAKESRSMLSGLADIIEKKHTNA